MLKGLPSITSSPFYNARENGFLNILVYAFWVQTTPG